MPLRLIAGGGANVKSDGQDAGRLWIHAPFVDPLLRRKHVLSILVVSYELGAMSTSQMIRSVRGHPAAVIETLGGLEGLGVLSRRVSTKGRRSVEIRLTVKGLQLMDTPMNHWGRLIRKWGSLEIPRAIHFDIRRE